MGLLDNRIPMSFYTTETYVQAYKGRSQMGVENINENSLPYKFAKMMEDLEKEFLNSV